MRQHAANWLELADKVEHYRRDVLEAAELSELRLEKEGLKRLVKDRASASDLKLGIETLEGVLKKTGGTFYPKSTKVEYVEFFLVASIVILGIRAFFFQPFKIPTNSMWPSYNGMTGQVYESVEDEPGKIAQGVRFLTQLAVSHRIDAPVSGEVRIPVQLGRNTRTGQTKVYLEKPRPEKGRKWLIIPTTKWVYRIFVDSTPVEITVPGDFDLKKVVLDAYFEGRESFPIDTSAATTSRGYVSTGKTVKAGERVLSFDVITGDQLFVDRISYHFSKPEVGDGFVFRTDNIPSLHRLIDGPNEQYYIKRLIGTPGDTLEIREPVLMRNGEPIEGAPAFASNAEREGRFPGYRPLGLLAEGRMFTVPEHEYMAIGDNSASSLDGRYWGTVPEKDIIGKPLFIYYPFNDHWGPAP